MDPSAEMQRAVVVRLKAHAGTTALISDRVYDHAPQDVIFPYVSIGNFQSVDDSAECIDGVEIFMDLHVWGRKTGQIEAKEIASAVRAALHEFSPTLADPFAMVGNIEHRTTRMMGDPDGKTTHGVLTFRAFVEAT